MTPTLKTLADELERLHNLVEPKLWRRPHILTDEQQALSVFLRNYVPEFLAALRACDVAYDALDRLARLGNGEHYGNSDGNMIARIALAELEKVGKL